MNVSYTFYKSRDGKITIFFFFNFQYKVLNIRHTEQRKRCPSYLLFSCLYNYSESSIVHRKLKWQKLPNGFLLAIWQFIKRTFITLYETCFFLSDTRFYWGEGTGGWSPRTHFSGYRYFCATVFKFKPTKEANIFFELFVIP